MSDVLQRSFEAGEISPTEHGRVDIARYAEGLDTCRNFFVHVSGGASNRSGFKFVGRTKEDANKVRLIPFRFNTVQTYCLEFGNQYVRVIKDGGYVTETAVTITGISQATPAVVTAANSYTAGDEVFISGVAGMTEVNGKRYIVAMPTGSDFELRDRDGDNVDATGFTPWESDGEAARLFTLSTPYTSSDLAALKFTQSADVMTLVHEDYDPRELARTDHDVWTLTVISFVPQIGKPTAVTALLRAETTVSGDDTYLKITAATESNPLTVSASAGPAFTEGDVVWINHATGMTKLNTSGPYTVKNVISPMALADWAGDDVDASTGWGTYTGSAGRLGKFQHKYRVTAIDAITGEESLPSDEDITAWTVSFAALSTEDTVKITWTEPSNANVKEYSVYKEKNGIYGFIGIADTTEFYDDNIAPELGDTPPQTPTRDPFNKTITGITNDEPAEVTATEHGYQDGDRVIIQDVVGMVEVNGGKYLVNSVTATTFELQDLDGVDVDATGFGAWTTGGRASDFPSCVTHFEQRRVFGQQYNNRQVLHLTQTGNLKNFNISSPSKDSDAFSFTIASSQVNEVRHLIPLNDLFLFTSGSTWKSASGDSSYALANVRNRPQEYTAVSEVPPIPTRNSILFVQDQQSVLWDLAFSFEQDSFRGHDLSRLSRHLIENKLIVEIAYAENPDSVVWCVRDDGELIAITYSRAHGVWGWHRHDTDGEFESVCTIQEGAEDAVYVVVKRRIDGSDRRMVERLQSRMITDIRDAFHLDSGLSFDNPIDITSILQEAHPTVTAPGHGMSENALVDIGNVEGMTEVNDTRYRAAGVTSSSFRLTGQYLDTGVAVTDITAADPPVVTAAAHGYEDGDVVYISGVAGMTEVNGLFFLVDDKTTNTFELQDMSGVDIVGSGYTAYTSGGTTQKTTTVDSTAYSAYTDGGKAREAKTVMTGLDHLEGKTVSILSDGSVEPQQAVNGGQVTLVNPGSRVHIGLPITSDLKTLRINSVEGATTGRTLNVVKVYVQLYRTRGFFAGPDEDHLHEWAQRDDEDYNEPTRLFTGGATQTIEPMWNDNGQVLIRQSDPLPITVLAVGADVEIGGR